jgi:hypothetical protein
MAKYQDGHYLELPRQIFTNSTFLNLSDSAKWLYFVLKEDEHKFTGSKEDFFFRSNEDLAKDCGWNIKKLERYKAELLKSGLITTWPMHWINKETGKKSEKHVTAYRIKA